MKSGHGWSVLFLLSIVSGPLIADGRSPLLKDPPAASHRPFVRYSGCIGGRAFSPGRQLDPARSCDNTIVNHACQISPETCCFRQCIYSFTGQVTDLERVAENSALKAMVSEAIARKLQNDLAISQSEGDLETARSTSASDIVEFYDTCIGSCTNSVKAFLSGMAKKRK